MKLFCYLKCIHLEKYLFSSQKGRDGMSFGTKKHTILVVDDNEFTVRILRHALTEAGFDVEIAYSGEEGLELIRTEGMPDLAVVDFHMDPGMSGIEFCKKVQLFSDLPIVMLTAVDDETMVEQCLAEYCEDYVRKPFSSEVLVARIRRVLARFEPIGTQKTIEIPIDDHLTINFAEQVANINGEAVSLTPIETKLLYVLVRQAGKPVNSQYLLRRIWPQEIAFEDRLHVHVHRLRRKIEDESHDPYIVSRRGEGYLFRLN
jgi:DNA-binding response OmpR family regulator